MVPKLIKIRKYFALRGSFAREWGGGGGEVVLKILILKEIFK